VGQLRSCGGRKRQSLARRDQRREVNPVQFKGRRPRPSV
jgi:hypothetical protein